MKAGNQKKGLNTRFDSLWQKTVISPLFLIFTFLLYSLLPDQMIKDRLAIGFKRSLRNFIKRGLDIALASIGIILSSVFFIIIPALIKLTSRGPIFYRQLRVGRNRRYGDDWGSRLLYQTRQLNFDRRKVDFQGQPFYLYKFRTMLENAELTTGPVWATENDPRITPVGRFLRATHLDELPQFFNVLKGEMSMVGPRPERPCFVTEFTDNIRNYSIRFKVKPGITGSAQIYNGYDKCLDDVKNKLKYEIEYIEKASVWTDVKLILLTVLSMIKREGDK